MGFPVITRCGSCCSLKIGAMCVAVGSIVLSLLNLLLFATGKQSESIRTSGEEFGISPSNIDIMVICLTILGVIANLIYLGVSGLLIVGLRKDSLIFMKPFIIWNLISCCLVTLIAIVMFSIYHAKVISWFAYWITIFSLVLIQLYFAYIVYCYMKLLENQNRREPVRMEDNL